MNLFTFKVSICENLQKFQNYICKKMDEEAETEAAQMPLSQSLESVTRKIQIKTKGKVFAVVRESYLRNWSL